MTRKKEVVKSRYPEFYHKKYYQNYGVFIKGMQLVGDFRGFIGANVHKGDSVLDIGCGRGEVLFFCRMLGAKCFGIDSSREAIRMAKKNLGGYLKKGLMEVVLMDVKGLKFDDNSFDIVVMMDLIEHLYPDEVERVLFEIKRVLRPGGKLLIHTSPNKNNIQIVKFLAHLFGLRLVSESYHVNEQTPRELAARLGRYFSSVVLRTIKDRNYFLGQMNERGMVLKRIARMADFFYDSRSVGYLMKFSVFSNFLATDVYAVCQK